MGDATINLIEADELPSSDDALERMMTFARQFGVAHTTLAMHAALPIGLTPEVVHLIRINFVPAAPWIAEADLLLSPLCREAGGDLYEMDAQVRELLLDEFNGNWRFGRAQLKKLAEFMLAYVSRARAQTRDVVTLDFLRAQEMVALAYAHPEEAARRFALAMRQGIEASDRDETLRMASLAQSLAAPLFAEGKVLIYAAGVEKLFDRDVDKAMRLFGAIGADTQSTIISGVTLPPATEMAAQLELTELAPAAPAPFPLGFTLRTTLRGHTHTINRMAWSPDGQHLASPSDDGVIYIWDIDTEEGRPIEIIDESGRREGEIRQVAWATYADRLATISAQGAVCIYEFQELVYSTTGYPQSLQGFCIAWSPDGSRLAWGTENSIFWIETGDALGQAPTPLAARRSVTNAVAWSPDGKTLAATAGAFVDLWDDLSGRPQNLYVSIERDIMSLAWSPDGTAIASGSTTSDITITDRSKTDDIRTLKGHRSYVTSLAFSFDGRLLASKSVDGTVRLWRCDRWEQVAVLDEPYPGEGVWSGLAFHPSKPILATLDASGTAIRIWDLNIKALLGPEPAPRTITYKNAKVVLLGKPGVGKTPLSLGLAGQLSISTNSTHGPVINSFTTQQAWLDDGSREVREILLWDLEGGPNYRITNQLHFDDIALALIVINTSEPTLESELRFWDQALQQARRANGNIGLPLKKFLVSYRQYRELQPDELGLIDRLCKEYAIESFYEDVANNSHNMTMLAKAIYGAMRWEEVPSLSVPDSPRFANASNTTTDAERGIALVGQAKEAISKFLNDEFGSFRPLFSSADLRSAIEKRFADVIPPDQLNARFDNGVRLAQTLGLLQRLNQGRDFLISPDHAIRAADEMIREAQKNPQGLGSFDEAEFRAHKSQESSDEMTAYYAGLGLQLVEFVTDELLLRELAFRVRVDGRNHLVFPSLLDLSGQPVLNEIASLAFATYSFTGPARAIYATLLTRLAHSKDFALQGTGTNGALFLRRSFQLEANSPSNWPVPIASGSVIMRAPATGGPEHPACAIILKRASAAGGQITLFFETGVDDATRFLFEAMIRAHLFTWSPQTTVTRQRIFVCQRCNTVFDSQAVNRQLNQGQDTIQCPVCDTINSLFDRAEAMDTALASITPEFPQQANTWQERERIMAELERKLATGIFDVFLSYHIQDKQAVIDIALRLLKRGILPWVDTWESHFSQEALRQQISQIKSVAFFSGSAGFRISKTTTYPLIHELLHAGLPEVPVILHGGQDTRSFPVSATSIEPIDFRINDPNPIDELVRAISTPPVSPRTTPTEKTSSTKRAAKKQTPRHSPATQQAPTRKSAIKSSIKKAPKKK